MNKYRVLVAEDDTETADLLKKLLEGEGYIVAVAADGEIALEKMDVFKPHLAILDVNMPQKSGIDVCRESRDFTSCPVLMLSALDDEESEDAGLNAGANEYITKPVRRKGLLTRINRILSAANNEQLPISHGNLVINTRTRCVLVSAEPLDVTTKQYDALLLLAENEGSVVLREELYKNIYNMEYDGANRNVDNLISRLRKILTDRSASVEIKTVTNKGYIYTHRDIS